MNYQPRNLNAHWLNKPWVRDAKDRYLEETVLVHFMVLITWLFFHACIMVASGFLDIAFWIEGVFTLISVSVCIYAQHKVHDVFTKEEYFTPEHQQEYDALIGLRDAGLLIPIRAQQVWTFIWAKGCMNVQYNSLVTNLWRKYYYSTAPLEKNVYIRRTQFLDEIAAILEPLKLQEQN